MAKKFGGQWTIDKLNIVEDYLKAYLKVFKNKPKYKLGYIDAFAGDGSINLANDDDAAFLVKGSARRALALDPGFHSYRFIELDKDCANHLKGELTTEFPHKDIEVWNNDANAELIRLCNYNWESNRAVVFLDPTGAQVEWPTIEAIAKTKGIDLWIWFPLGVAVQRLLSRRGHIKKGNEERLNKIFGTTEWKDAFYETKKELTLFGDQETERKVAKTQDIARFYIEQLKSVFPHVSEVEGVMYNSKNSPIYMLCFAAAAPGNGGKLAVKIATSLLRKI